MSLLSISLSQTRRISKKGHIIVKIIQMSIILIAAVRGSEEDIPMKLVIAVKLMLLTRRTGLTMW